MPTDDPNVPADIGRLAEQASKVKLPGGIVGKLSTVLIVSAISIGAIACAARDPWVSAGSVLTIFILILVLGWRMLAFAEKHPQAALMEGAEFLSHERLALAMKGQPQIVLSYVNETDNPEEPQPFLSEGEARLPDAVPTEKLEGE